MIPADKVQLALKLGYSYICALCVKLHEGQDKGLGGCTAVDGCAGPVYEGTFHEYEGPITNFLSVCFVCGEKPTKGLKVRGHTRIIGACDQHVGYVVQMAPDAKRHLPVHRTIVANGATETSAEDMRPKAPGRPKTFGELLHQIETGTFKPDD